MRQRRVILILLLLLLSCAPLGAQEIARVAVSAQTQSGLTLSVSGLRVEETRVEGKSYRTFNSPSAVAADSSRTPALVLSIAVPPDASGITARLDSGGGAGSVTVSPAVRWRGWRVVRVVYRPALPVGASLLAPARITVAWGRTGTGSAATLGRSRSDAVIDRMSRNGVLNGDEAAAWWNPPRSSARRPAAAGGWGMEQGVVVLVPRDGSVRVSGRDLRESTRGEAVSLLASSLRVRSRGQDVPFAVDDRNSNGVVDEEDAVEFRGRRNPSAEPELYWDAETDTNAYVLSWGGGATRLLVRDSASAAAADLRFYDSTLHFEEELQHNGGWPSLNNTSLGDAASFHRAERVPGERELWTVSSYPVPTAVDVACSPQYLPDATIEMRVRLMGLSDTTHARGVMVNGNAVDTVVCRGFCDTTFVMAVPAYLFIQGLNRVTIVPVAPPEVPVGEQWKGYDLLGLDYVELRGTWRPAVRNDRATLRLPAGGEYRATLRGFTAPPVFAVGENARFAVDSVRRGFHLRVASRQYPEVPLRFNNPGFTITRNDTVIGASAGDGPVYAEFDASTGQLLRMRTFDTYTNPALFDSATAFLRSVAAGNIVVGGVSIGAGANALPTAFREELRALVGTGVVDRTDLVLAAWAFAVRKGDTATLEQQFIPQDLRQGVALDAFIPNAATGDRWEARVGVKGEAGEEFIVSPPVATRLRYHRADSLVDAANGADLTIITHPAFRSASERLAAYRRSADTLRVRVVDVESVYDEFNNGVKSWRALHRFLHYADTNWAAPAPTAVLLMGNASTDPMLRLRTPQISREVDYVPTFGNPVSDYHLTVAPQDSSLQYQMLIGRIPATTVPEAEGTVDKIISYETGPPAEWNTRHLFLDGGLDVGEVLGHYNEDQGLASRFVLSPLYQGDTAFVLRSQPNPFPDDREGPRVRAEIDRGALVLSFAGHGASTVFDLDFGYPAEMRNADRLFVLATFSCRTGAFGDPEAPARNETFLLSPVTGAIASLGASNYSFPIVDAPFREKLWQEITEFGNRNLGEAFTRSRYEGMIVDQFLQYGWWFTNEGFVYRNSLLMYHLLGDPMLKLASRSTPELRFQTVAVGDEEGNPLSPADTAAAISVEIRNVGRVLPPDSDVVVAGTMRSRDGVDVFDTVRVRFLTRTATATLRFPIDGRADEYQVHLSIDPDQRLAETWRADNDTTIGVATRSSLPLALTPLPFDAVESRALRIRVLDPSPGPAVRFLLDSTPRFDGAGRIGSESAGTIVHTELTTEWRVEVPERLVPGGVGTLWWRAETAGADEATGEGITVESFTLLPNRDSALHVIVRDSSGWERGLPESVVVERGGVGAGSGQIAVSVMSVGHPYQGNRTSARVGRTDFFSLNRDGVNVAVLAPGSDSLVVRQAFEFYWQSIGTPGRTDIDDFLKMIDTVKPGERVIIAFGGPSFFLGDKGDQIRERLHRLGGSAVVDSLVNNDSYALVGGIGLPADQIHEAWNAERLAGGGAGPFPATISTTIPLVPRAGRYTSPTLGPTLSWGRLDAELSGAGALPADVFGVRRDGVRDSLLRVVVGSGPVDIGSIDAERYPRLEVRVLFPADTAVRLRSLRAVFDPAPDLALNPSTSFITPDSVLLGDSARAVLRVVNLSHLRSSRPTVVRVVQRGVPAIINDSVAVPAIAPLDSALLSVPLPTAQLRGDYQVILALNPDNSPVEPYTSDNVLERSIRISGDSSAPSVALYADNARLMEGDYVPRTARLEVRIFDNARLPLDSATTIRRMILDNEIITPTSPGVSFRQMGEGTHRASFFYQPPVPLAEGQHEVRIFTRDASGNLDTTDFITFYVDGTFRLRNVVNWPNPFPRTTTFTFLLSGERPPVEGEIAIYTVAGRRIKAIPLRAGQLTIGFNRVEWDGLDADGDRLANGTYLYRLRVSDGENTTETIEKLVVLR